MPGRPARTTARSKRSHGLLWTPLVRYSGVALKRPNAFGLHDMLGTDDAR